MAEAGRGMRTRLIRPEFWADSRMADLAEGTRLTYVGLWCLADDEGYLSWQARDIAAELYRFEPPRRREAKVDKQLVELTDSGRVRVLDCGVHALIPSLTRHRIKGGNTTDAVKRQHDKCSVRTRPQVVQTSTDKSVSVSVSDSVTDSSSVSGSLRARDDEKTHDPEKAWNDLGVQWGRKKPPALPA